MAEDTTGSKFRQCAKTLSDPEQAGGRHLWRPLGARSEARILYGSQRPYETSLRDLIAEFNVAARTWHKGLRDEQSSIY